MASKRQQDRAFEKARQNLKDIDETLTPNADDELRVEDDDSDAEEKKVEAEQAVVEAFAIGAGMHEAVIYRHNVRFKLLNIRQEIQACSLCKATEKTSAYVFAMKTAYFAMSCQAIDEIPFYSPISETAIEPSERWKLALDYYRPFIEAFWKEYAAFRDDQMEQLESVKK